MIEEKGCEMLEKNGKRYRTVRFGHYGLSKQQRLYIETEHFNDAKTRFQARKPTKCIFFSFLFLMKINRARGLTEHICIESRCGCMLKSRRANIMKIVNRRRLYTQGNCSVEATEVVQTTK